jgi:predicted protein tyrosine phosphatase
MAPRRDDVIAFARNFESRNMKRFLFVCGRNWNGRTDDFAFMDPELVSLLKAKVTPYLR